MTAISGREAVMSAPVMALFNLEPTHEQKYVPLCKSIHEKELKLRKDRHNSYPDACWIEFQLNPTFKVHLRFSFFTSALTCRTEELVRFFSFSVCNELYTQLFIFILILLLT